MTRVWRSGNIAPSRPSTPVTESRNMKDAEFKRQFDATLLAIEQAIENSGADIEFETANDILTLEFPNRSKIIINAQSAVRQLWVAVSTITSTPRAIHGAATRRVRSCSRNFHASRASRPASLSASLDLALVKHDLRHVVVVTGEVCLQAGADIGRQLIEVASICFR
jgi:hypothetical protein